MRPKLHRDLVPPGVHCVFVIGTRDANNLARIQLIRTDAVIVDGVGDRTWVWDFPCSCQCARWAALGLVDIDFWGLWILDG
jgi:hypothetical protein